MSNVQKEQFEQHVRHSSHGGANNTAQLPKKNTHQTQANNCEAVHSPLLPLMVEAICFAGNHIPHNNLEPDDPLMSCAPVEVCRERILIGGPHLLFRLYHAVDISVCTTKTTQTKGGETEMTNVQL